MEHPVREISDVIETLTKGSPQQQEHTLNEYFLPDASFTHPFCRVPSFGKNSIPFARDAESRWLILGIYRWYRTLSPHIDLKVDSAVFDQRTGVLYVSIRQVFSVWFIPFYRAPVKLVTVLQLASRSSSESGASKSADGRASALAGLGQERSRYYISSQEDLYQSNDCVQFVLPTLGPLLLFLFQLYSTGLCIVGSLIFLPLYNYMNKGTATKKSN